jgi:hypothetical protein
MRLLLLCLFLSSFSSAYGSVVEYFTPPDSRERRYEALMLKRNLLTAYFCNMYERGILPNEQTIAFSLQLTELEQILVNMNDFEYSQYQLLRDTREIFIPEPGVAANHTLFFSRIRDFEQNIQLLRRLKEEHDRYLRSII